MGEKTPGKGPGCFKYAKFLIFDETLQPQKFVPGMCKIAHNLLNDLIPNEINMTQHFAWDC